MAPNRSVVDEESLLQHVEADSQEAIVSNLGLHWVNDIPGKLYFTGSAERTEVDVRHHRCVEANPRSFETRWVLPG